MYLKHFGLREAPFGVASDRRFTFFGKEHREAISSLYVGILEGRGISAVVGRPGMGKTTIANYLLARLQGKAVTCRLDYPFRQRSDLMCGILSELGLDSSEERDFRQLKLLEGFCVEKSQGNRKTVLFFDEAQALSLDSLEQIRLLSNLRSKGKPVLEIVLAGHPCLADTIRTRELESLRQRIGVFTHIPPLDEESIREYIAHRLRVAGQEKPLFSDDALSAVASLTEGIPRNVNHLCHSAMLLACAQDDSEVSQDSVWEASSEFQMDGELASDGPTALDNGWEAPPLSWVEPPAAQANGRCSSPARHFRREDAVRPIRLEPNQGAVAPPRLPPAGCQQAGTAASHDLGAVSESLSGIERATEVTPGKGPEGAPGWPGAHASALSQPYEERAAPAAVLDRDEPSLPSGNSPSPSFPDVWSSFLLFSSSVEEEAQEAVDRGWSGGEDARNT